MFFAVKIILSSDVDMLYGINPEQLHYNQYN